MKKFQLFILLLLLSMYFLPSLTLAAVPSAGSGTAGSETAGNPVVSLTNPLGEGKTDIPTLLGTIINYTMGIVGSLALVMFIYGGLTWMLSGGNQEQVTKGKQIIIWAALGIAIIFTSYVLVRFVITAFGGQ